MSIERGVVCCVVGLCIEDIGEMDVQLDRFCGDMLKGRGICLFLVVRGDVSGIY